MKRCLLTLAALCALTLSTAHAQAVQPLTAPVLASDIADRYANLTKLMTSELLVKLLDQGVVKLDDPLSKYAPPGARVPTYQGAPITLVNLATHTSALPREQPGGVPHRPVFVWPTREQRWNYLSTATLKAAPGSQASYSNLAFDPTLALLWWSPALRTRGSSI